MLGLRFCAMAFSSCGKWGPLLIAVRGPLTIVASLVADRPCTILINSGDGENPPQIQIPIQPPKPTLQAGLSREISQACYVNSPAQSQEAFLTASQAAYVSSLRHVLTSLKSQGQCKGGRM